ncbi:substrate-binding domain-containing protein [Piscinibacter sp. XHJ-5]|uniref:substrate-binding domain-containing protein n=1 Tax=Piscinibacter sp. XHJ-5 TaxID=3037797 RepID=UPI002452E0CF|nr:substrate-binding domain-containing protein [Piscinibacter sp. XHJ-5]
MSSRRHSLIRLGAGAAWLATPALALAAQRQSLADPLRLAADDALIDSGLAPLLQRSFGQDTGVAVELLHGPATVVLGALERGEHDAALTNAPEVELGLEKQGLIHDRRAIVGSQFVLVGPAALAKPLSAGRDVALALSRLAQAQAPFMSRPDGSGTHLAEQVAWRAAATAPGGEWYLRAEAGKPLLAQARERQACAIVERGVWAAQGGGKGMAVLSEGDPRLAVDVHVMRTFRAERQHPAGKLFVGWISGPKGRHAMASLRGYLAPRA